MRFEIEEDLRLVRVVPNGSVAVSAELVERITLSLHIPSVGLEG